MESIMTISLSKRLGSMHKPRGIRNAASRIRFLVARSAKTGIDSVSIDPSVNSYLFSTAIKNRSRIKLSISRSGDKVKVTLHGTTVTKQAQQQKQDKQQAKKEQKKQTPVHESAAGKAFKEPKPEAKKQEESKKPGKSSAEGKSA